VTRFQNLLNSFQNATALVVGDVMLDEYIFGTATRISPEAPVMVIRHRETSCVPGGAANVALNIRALGGNPILVGVLGKDAGGDELTRGLSDAGLSADHLLTDPTRSTTVKTRVVANAAHQVLRIDREDTFSLSESLAMELVERARALISSGQIQVVLASDYQKGVLSQSIIQELIRTAIKHKVPFVANAKPETASHYAGATLVSLNRSESESLLGRSITKNDATVAAREVQQVIGCEHALVTIGADGMATAEFQIQPISIDVYDPAGAGDTAIATVALGLGTEGYSREVFELAVRTSGKVVQHIGVAVPSESDIASIQAETVS
jgi:D-beta-D-heptose 7-phosphate kinase/D-beta-D-heptose 1-phosphate adenosyltransferase